MSVLSEPTQEEIAIIKIMRDVIEQTVVRKNMNDDVLAEKLGLLPSGVVGLFQRRQWSIEEAMRIASALGIHYYMMYKVG